jgi:hypothetical protein
LVLGGPTPSLQLHVKRVDREQGVGNKEQGVGSRE